jgi:hypothetical protein
VDVGNVNADEAKMIKSKTLPDINSQDTIAPTNEWGSFNSSFFDSKTSPALPITNAPPRKSETSSGS